MNVLVISQDATLRVRIIQLLHQVAGFEVIAVRDIKSGDELIKTWPADLVVHSLPPSSPRQQVEHAP